MAVSAISSSFPMRQMGRASQGINKNLERLSSGRRINRASDDAAILALSEMLKGEIASLEQASRNVDYGESLSGVADSAMESQGDIAIRMRELATQSANGTLGETERAAIQDEFNELRSEFDRIGSSTTFNGKQLLQGESFDIQAGSGTTVNDVISLDTPTSTSATYSFDGSDVLSQSGAQDAMGALDSAISSIARNRGRMGASVNRLHSARSSLSTTVENGLSSLSRMVDADVTQESSKLATNKALLGAATGSLRHAQNAKGYLLNLLA